MFVSSRRGSNKFEDWGGGSLTVLGLGVAVLEGRLILLGGGGGGGVQYLITCHVVKHNALQLPYNLFASIIKTFFRVIRRKSCFTDHRTANTILLVAAIKGNFSGQFLF